MPASATRPLRPFTPADFRGTNSVFGADVLQIRLQADRDYTVNLKPADVEQSINRTMADTEWNHLARGALPDLLPAIDRAFEVQALNDPIDEASGEFVPSVWLSREAVVAAFRRFAS